MTFNKTVLLSFALISSFSIYPVQANSHYKMIAPGGGGKITTVAINPNNNSEIIYGTDVGGVFRTLDAGASFEKVSKGLFTKQIYDSHIAIDASLNTVVYLGTSDGVYKSSDMGGIWSLKETEFFAEAHNFTHPVYSVVTAPSNSNIVWAAIGEAVTADFRENDAHTVYKSSNAGATWMPVFHIPTVNDLNLGGEVEVRARVVTHPVEEDTVFIASNRGLFATYDGGSSWYELGKENVFIQNGSSWEQCTIANCSAEIMNRPRCTDSNCLPLPILDNMGASHATLTNMQAVVTAAGDTHLYAVLDDYGHMESTCSGSINDVNLTKVTGGPYKSVDGGLTWAYLFKTLPDPAHAVDHRLRCNESVNRSWNGTYFNNIAVNPQDNNHFFITATYLGAGVIEFYNGEWSHHSKGNLCAGNSCFEGGATQGMWANQAGPTVIDFDVVDWGKTRPDFMVTHSRGVIEGVFSDGFSAYELNHVDSDEAISSNNEWKGNGLTDYCPIDIAFDDTGEDVFISGQDSGVVVSENAGTTWRKTDGGTNNNDASLAIVRDAASGIVYASRYSDGNENRNNVSYRDPLTGNWVSIGGFCGTGSGCTSSSSDNGLPSDLRVNDLQLNYSTNSSARGLFAGTENGLYEFDPAAIVGSQWSLVNASGCPIAPPGKKRSVKRVITRVDYPNNIFFSVISDTNSAIKNGATTDPSAGLFVYKPLLTVPQCSNLSFSSTNRDVRAPHDFVFASSSTGQDVIVAAGQYSWNPRVFRTEINLSNLSGIDWSIVADYSKLSTISGVVLGDESTFDNKNFILETDTSDSTRVLLGVKAAPYFDHYAHSQVYVSENAGELNSFRVATELSELPDKDLSFMRFSISGDKLYIAPSCGGLYRTINPFVDTDADGANDAIDNCPIDSNAGQENADNDGMGDVCDIDDDNDGLDDSYELSIGTNPLLVDTDSDGFDDGLEDVNGSNPLLTSSTPANGDINENGVLDAGDFLIATRIVTGLLTPSPQQLLRCDIFPMLAGIPVPDGNITLSDLILIQRKLLDLMP